MSTRTAVVIGALILLSVGLLAWQALLPRYVVEGEGVRDRWTQEYCPMTEIAVDVLRDEPSEANAAQCPSGKYLVTRGDGTVVRRGSVTSIFVEWSDPPRIVGTLPQTVTGTWSQFRRLEDSGLVHREREMVIFDDGDVRAMYRITGSDMVNVRMELAGTG